MRVCLRTHVYDAKIKSLYKMKQGKRHRIEVMIRCKRQVPIPAPSFGDVII